MPVTKTVASCSTVRRQWSTPGKNHQQCQWTGNGRLLPRSLHQPPLYAAEARSGCATPDISRALKDTTPEQPATDIIYLLTFIIRPFHCKAGHPLLQGLVGRPLHENDFTYTAQLGISWTLGWGKRENARCSS